MKRAGRHKSGSSTSQWEYCFRSAHIGLAFSISPEGLCAELHTRDQRVRLLALLNLVLGEVEFVLQIITNKFPQLAYRSVAFSDCFAFQQEQQGGGHKLMCPPPSPERVVATKVMSLQRSSSFPTCLGRGLKIPMDLTSYFLDRFRCELERECATSRAFRALATAM